MIYTLQSAIQHTYQHFRATHPIQRVRLGGARWEYIACGAGPETVVLLPGGFGAADTSFQQIAALEGAHRVLTVTYPPTITTVDGLCSGLAALLAHTQVAQAHIVGGSASGLVAQCFVRRYPQCVASLVLSYTSLPQPARARWLAPGLALLARMPMPLLRAVLGISNARFLPEPSPVQQFWRGYFANMMQQLTRDSLLNRFRMLLDIDRNEPGVRGQGLGFRSQIAFQSDPMPENQINAADWYHPLNVPMLILAAAHDSFVAPGEQQRLWQAYPHAEWHLFPAGIHADSVTDPAPEIRLISDFLARASGKG